MRGNHPPSLSKAHPGLALAAANDAAVLVSFELEVDAAEIAPKRGYVETCDAAGEVGRRPRGTKGGDLFDAVEILRCAESNYIRRRPEESLHRLDVVIHQSGFILGIDGGELGNVSRDR